MERSFSLGSLNHIPFVYRTSDWRIGGRFARVGLEEEAESLHARDYAVVRIVPRPCRSLDWRSRLQTLKPSKEGRCAITRDGSNFHSIDIPYVVHERWSKLFKYIFFLPHMPASPSLLATQ